jgi:membrane-bound lytic murein transglycosylase D
VERRRLGGAFAHVASMNRYPLLILIVALASACATATSTPPPPTASVPASNVAWDLSDIDHERVDYWVTRFTSDKKAEFESYLTRKREFEAMISEKLRQRGMPQDLIYLAMIESGFNPEAHSAQSARGIWQLIPDTARRYKLQVDDTVDERLDPAKSTDAALAYLQDLYERFGSWYLAAAAYNAGENRVGRVMTEVTGAERGTDADYYRIWDQLPGETRDFVPVMIAAARVAKEPSRYGFAE